MNKNENKNKQQTPAEIYNSSEAINNRDNLRKEINSRPRADYSKAFTKDDKEKGEFLTERNKWRKEIKAQGFGKRNAPMRTYVKVS